jgi:uncharacterized protein (TIGR02391 family)
MEKLLAYCTHCGNSQGTFADENELRLKIADKRKCENCNVNFGFLRDGRIWNLEWETIQSSEAFESSTFDFWSIIHNSIVSVAKEKFEDEHFADAAESAFKEVNTRVKGIVKNKIGEELDGANLMFKAFPSRNPLIILGDLSTETGRNIQEGYLHIFAGAMLGIRNPKAHDNITISRERAIHFIVLASLLMYKLDEATI